ncbi:SOS response-associated peptidase [Stratiformator vulcanicus]|uniref:Abasic site processing protein n=1 Tax=Stratiformator vulcanicus TaxID=2527980 RepID=A0A517QZJ5_9PLAN|nr:SOS response-associated peptidase [Stratiformator vulcanicus]QDT36970.1 Putative SOS response-associated peptidase YedK [Stratiformator vulcanicus]
MCGRINLRTSNQDLSKLFTEFEQLQFPDIEPRYNIAPSQPVLAVREIGQTLSADFLKWGFRPPWWKPKQPQPINAKAESIESGRYWTGSFRHHRCLIPVSGFYEWKASEDGKQPFQIGLESGEPFCLGGLWNRWEAEDGSSSETFAVITVPPNDLMKSIHNRMPLIIGKGDFGMWLAEESDGNELSGLLKPYESDALTAYAVSTVVNNPRNDSRECIEPVASN